MFASLRLPPRNIRSFRETPGRFSSLFTSDLVGLFEEEPRSATGSATRRVVAVEITPSELAKPCVNHEHVGCDRNRLGAFTYENLRSPSGPAVAASPTQRLRCEPRIAFGTTDLRSRTKCGTIPERLSRRRGGHDRYVLPGGGLTLSGLARIILVVLRAAHHLRIQAVSAMPLSDRPSYHSQQCDTERPRFDFHGDGSDLVDVQG